MNIVVIEDNDDLRNATVGMLAHHGHWATGLVCAEDVDDICLNPYPELFVIDLNLPGEDGLSLARRLRLAQPLVGIIMVTARNLLGDKLAGYENGTDIYLPKPVDPTELLAAVESLGRRIRSSANLLQKSHLEVSLFLEQASRTLRGPRGQLTLSESETALLAGLCRAPSHRLETWQLMKTLNEDPETYTKSALEVRLVRLRQKLVDAGAKKGCLPAVRGFGYQLATQISIV
jgi:DNA-binding response OmpR family regulator